MSNNDPQKNLNLPDDAPLDSVEQYRFEREPIKGQPELRWTGKRPFTGTQYYPAQLRETYGQPMDGWLNRIYWGDNLQVMSHLLKEFRGKVQLVYIDPPFDSKADYKIQIKVKTKAVENDYNIFEEKQYSDMWNNDAYIQLMYERLCLIKELLNSTGNIYLHCDYHKSHHIKCILDEIFGPANFRSEIIWVRSTNPKGSQHESRSYSQFTDTIFFYSKSNESKFFLDKIRVPLTKEELLEKYHRIDEKGRFYDGPIIRSTGMGDRPNLVYEYNGYIPSAAGWRMNIESLKKLDEQGNLGWSSTGEPFRKLRPNEDKGKPVGNFWNDISLINSQADERVGYPTQKPEKLLERIVKVSSDPGDLVLDCFMGSGTTQAVAMKLGRRFLGADINLGAVEITSRRLISVAAELNNAQRQQKLDAEWQNEDGETRPIRYYTGFSVYNVNHYDVFRNPVEARGLLLEALEIQAYPPGHVFDGEKDGQQVKLMPVNRIATRADLNDLIANLDYKTLERRHADAPNQPTERILLVCMGHEPDLAAQLQQQVPFKLAIRVYDVLRDGQHLTFKRPAEAHLTLDNGELVIDRFYPMNLLQKLSLLEENVDDWRQLVETVKVDWQHNGQVFAPALIDAAEGETLVKGRYPMPPDAARIKVKITDLLSESWEGEINAGG